MKTPLKSFAFAIAGLGVIATSVPALANDGTYVPQARLHFDDLDLATRSGQRQLDQRIDALAKEMCGANTVITGTRIRKNSVAIRDCVKAARASANQQVATIIEDQQRGG